MAAPVRNRRPSLLGRRPGGRMSLTQALLTATLLVGLAIPAPAQQRFAELGRWQLPAGHGAQALAFGDVDGDGDLDLVCGNVVQNRLYLNNGSGVFTDATAAQMPVDGYAESVALGDIDGDGDLDIVFGTGFGVQNRLYLNNGSGVFTDATAAQMPVDGELTLSVALGDVDGDGDLDIVCGNGGDLNVPTQNRLYLNNGGGVFTDVTAAQMPVGGSTTSVALGDVDGDGDLDIVCGRRSYCAWCGWQNALYLNNGNGTFTDATTQMPVVTDLTNSVALGDVDGDGDLDLVCGNSWGENRLHLNNGSGVFTDVTAARMPVDFDFTLSVVLGDVDEDGDLDLVCGNGYQQNRLYLNNGTGGFTDATAAQMPVDLDGTRSVALGDVDGDGDLDLVCGNGYQQNRLYLNLERQLHAPNLLQVGQAYQLDAYARYGPARLFDVALPYLSTTRVSIPLPPYGILGIAPMAALPPILIPQPAGVGSVTLNVPNNPALAGIAIHTQAMLIQYPVRERLTNVVTDVIR